MVEKLQSLRGMVDLLPEQTSLWQSVETTAREHFRRAGVQEIRTPLLEPTELFARGIGEATDVVGKEMYSFVDRGDRRCTLRPEGTASVVRAAIQHGLLSQGAQRLWYGGPMFRYERPQAGRQRQFHQIGLELLGVSQARADVEAIAIAWDLLADLGVRGLALELNTLGSPEDRACYRERLVSFLSRHRDQLDPDSQDRLERNPLRILDSKNADTQALLAEAPTLREALAPESTARFEQVCAGLAALQIPFTLNPRLVRGLDYYSHTAFEITSTQLGAQATVCGGGRYDGLVEQLGGVPTPAIGWALGMERLVLLLAQGDTAPAEPSPDLYLVNRGEGAEAAALVLARDLRRSGLSVDLDASGAAFAKQFRRADRSGAAWVAVLGDGELERGVVRVRSLRSEQQEQELSLTDLSALIGLIAGPEAGVNAIPATDATGELVGAPRLSIVVATWNCAPQLAQFLASLAEQRWSDWQLLLLDNASTDGTAALVAEVCGGWPRSAERVIWSSEPDVGIYDAWNRGLRLARGTYICFIGADDVFLNAGSLERIAALTATGADLITARNAYHARDGRLLRHWGAGWQWQRMRQSMNIAHPGMLIHRELFAQVGGFDSGYRICGDYEWFLRLPPDLRTVHTSDSILKVIQGGVSHTRIPQVFAETFQAQRRHLGVPVSAACWALNWAKYGRRRLIGLA